MGRTPLRYAAILALSMAALPVAAQDRALPRLDDDVAAQFPAIGRLGQAGFRERQGCTATLIAPDLILTAAHCAAASGQSGNVFVAGWSRGDYIAARPSQREIRHPAYALDGAHRPNNDIALIVLESPITEVTPIPLGDVETGTLMGKDVALIGYHHRTPHLLSGDFSCPVARFGLGLMEVGCPVIGGNSGAPILNQADDGTWQIVGVISSQNGDTAIAVALPDWLRRQVEEHEQD